MSTEEGVIKMVALHVRYHLFPCTVAPDSAIWQEWDYLSERSAKSLPDTSCILGQQLPLSSILHCKIRTLLGQKKKKKAHYN